jgi:hypothetical protein
VRESCVPSRPTADPWQFHSHPVHVYWSASRTADGARGPKQLVIKGHYAALVTDQSEEGGVIFHLDDDAFAYPPEDREEYKRAMARALKQMAARGACAESLHVW